MALFPARRLRSKDFASGRDRLRFHRVGSFSPPARSISFLNGVLKGHSGRFWCNPRSDPRNIGDVAQSEEHLLCKQGSAVRVRSSPLQKSW